MTLKKWFFLFSTTVAIGAGVCMVAGLIMLLTDREFGFFQIELETGNHFIGILLNLLLMALAGLTIGAFSHMGFFAYLTLNYIALSVFRKKYLWNALQSYTTIFAAFFLGYILYNGKTNNWFFWVFPAVLLLASFVVAKFKVKVTKKEAFIPTLFLMFVVTAIEAYPALQGDSNIRAILFMILPLFVCNAYQNHMLGKLSTSESADSTVTTAKSALS